MSLTKLYVRFDHKVAGTRCSDQDFNDHLTYLQQVATERQFTGGGFVNHPGGMIVYAADDYEQAKMIADHDPIISRNLYTYDLYEWDIKIQSK